MWRRRGCCASCLGARVIRLSAILEGADRSVRAPYDPDGKDRPFPAIYTLTRIAPERSGAGFEETAVFDATGKVRSSGGFAESAYEYLLKGVGEAGVVLVEDGRVPGCHL